MKKAILISSLLWCFYPLSFRLSAQPINDDCGGAFNIVISESEENVILTGGDTRGATPSSIPKKVCSTGWYSDDIFFRFTTPSFVNEKGIIIRAYFDQSIFPSDVTAIGMALYESCDSAAKATHCFSSDDPAKNRFEVSGLCLLTDHIYYLRVWSTGGDPATEGTLRIGIYLGKEAEPYLWWETFGGGLEANGWTTYGTCQNPDSNKNAFFKYLAEGLIDSGAYAALGYRIASTSFCDGAVGVDSDYNDTNGHQNSWGGPCPTPGTKFLISPAIFSGDWNAFGLMLTWTQAIREYQSTFFISWRTKDVNSDWSAWIDKEINTEFPINSNFFDSDVQRHFIPGAAGHDSVQIKFTYNDNYYFWVIDDVKIIETECNNLRIDTSFYAIPPWVQIPGNEIQDFTAMAGIHNAGACPQTNVVLNFTVVDIYSGNVVYNESIIYDRIGPDSLAEKKVFPKLIKLPGYSTTYKGTYTVSSGVADFDSTDNVLSFEFSVGGNYFAHEDGPTRSFSINGNVWIFEPPLATAFGNIFRPVSDVLVDHIVWGVHNPGDMMGKTVNVFLIEWTDTNDNLIAEASERRFVGYEDYTFTGNEGDNVILETFLEHFEVPGSPIIMRAGLNYMAMMQYEMTSVSDPELFLLASEAKDFSAQVIGMDSAYSKGLTDERLFMTVFGFSPDGILDNADYEVRELDENDNRVHFVEDIVPLIRVGRSAVNTKNELPYNNLISIYPNPTSDHIEVKIAFEKPYRDVQLHLINHLGQIVFRKLLKGIISTHTELITIDNLPAGNYLLQVETIDGQRSVPVVVIR